MSDCGHELHESVDSIMEQIIGASTKDDYYVVVHHSGKIFINLIRPLDIEDVKLIGEDVIERLKNDEEGVWLIKNSDPNLLILRRKMNPKHVPTPMLIGKEYILCAANHVEDGKVCVHRPANITTGFVICGQRHHNCYQVMSMTYITDDQRIETLQNTTEGFLTSLNRFVDREEGMIIATEAKQLEGRKIHVEGKLHSEDLY